MDDKRKGLLFLHSAILIFGGTGLFAKLIALPATDITVWRSFIAVGVILALLLIRRRPLALQRPRDALIMALGGSLLGLHWATYFQAMQVAGVAVGMVAMYTYPIMIVFLEPLFKGHRPHRSDVLCALVMLAGIVLLVPEFDLDNNITQGVCWGVLSAALFALRNVIQGHYLKGYSGETSILYQGVLAGLVIIPFMTTDPRAVAADDLLKLLLLGALFTALPHSFFANSLRYLKAKTVGLIGCLQPVYGTLLAFLLLAEEPGLMTLLGGAIIIGTAAFETYRS
ncbi:DMT family transporter [Ketobacter sp.]|uniref:DMT family transporter n=1 Tax=Ketobacter sp. TaxID=2083498 RepID=UPI000F1C4CCD|nr:DMT family transporter [Ketobacter sp.]RLU01032.1 MAG: DMT family transporter [Ketobacter sp.]